MVGQRDEHVNPDQPMVLSLFRRLIPMNRTLHGQKLLVRRNGVLWATSLLTVPVLIEVAGGFGRWTPFPRATRGRDRRAPARGGRPPVPGRHRDR